MSTSDLNFALHPHHVSLASQPHTFQAFYKSFADRINSFHDRERMKLQGNSFVPLFDVIETERCYVLDGEVPGVGDQESIHVTWRPNQVLVISAVAAIPENGEATDAIDTDNDWIKTTEETCPSILSKSPGDNGAKTDKIVATFPRQLLHERHLGTLQRSFTFPGGVDEAGLKATLKHGVLKIVVPKKMDGKVSETRVKVNVL